MILKEAIEKRRELDGSREAVFLVCVQERVGSVYEKIGFVSIPSKPGNGAMVLIPDENLFPEGSPQLAAFFFAR